MATEPSRFDAGTPQYDRGAPEGLTCAALPIGMFARLSLLALLAGCTAPSAMRGIQASPLSKDALEQGFRNPPHAARPHVWWHWMNGNVDANEAVADLKWAAAQGIGGVHIFEGGLNAPKVVDRLTPYMSTDWQAAMRASVAAAERLGLDVSIPTAPGWSATGGPWVKPEQAMKKLVWSETLVEQGARIIRLEAPPRAAGPYQDVRGDERAPAFYSDVAVLAFPAQTDMIEPAVTGSGLTDGAFLQDGQFGSVKRFLPDEQGNATITYHYPRPVIAQAVTVGLPAPHGFGAPPPPTAFIEYSENGTNWRKLVDLPASSAPARTAAFAPMKARWFRLTVQSVKTSGLVDGLRGEPGATPIKFPPSASGFDISEFQLFAAPRIDAVEVKAGFAAATSYVPSSPEQGRAGIDPARILDLSDKLRPNDVLDWAPPAGRWTVLRFGMSLTGHMNGPAPAEATGLEVDKLSADHVRAYLYRYLASYDRTLGGTGRVNGLLSDSIESGAQNWTETMPSQFLSKRGYSLTRYLPALAGYVVADSHRTDAFLYDFRRTIADLLTEAHYGTIAQVAAERRQTYYAEALEDHRPQLGDDLAMRALADVPSAAMWFFEPGTEPRPTLVADLQGAASVAHVTGKHLVGVETLSAFGYPWALFPGRMRAGADRAFLLGGNRLMLHSMVHQAAGVRLFPGSVLLSQLGHNFNRNESWAPLARGWIDYLTRSAFLLQQGRPQADFAYFIGEEAPVTALFGDVPPSGTPDNLSYDFVDRSLLDQLGVSDRRLQNRSGGSYNFLFLGGSSQWMTLGTLSRLEELADAGVTIAGLPPSGSPSLADQQQTSGQPTFAARVDALWSRINVLTADTPQAAASQLKLRPQWNYAGSGSIEILHRVIPSGDIYYVVNPSDVPARGTLDLSYQTGVAQWWDAVLNTIEGATNAADGKQIMVDLRANESRFLVVRQGGPEVPTWTTQGSPAATGSWSVSLAIRNRPPLRITMDRLAPLEQNDDPAVWSFSGVATYSTKLLAPSVTPCRGGRIWLEFAAVNNVGRVTLNGKELGSLWTQPFRVDATAMLSKGQNELKVEVANSWKNRLTALAKQGDAQAMQFYGADAPASPSGLSGEVRFVERCPIAPLPR